MPTPKVLSRSAAWQRGAIIGIVAMAAILSGCAVTYTDKAGTRHTIGLVDIAVKAPADPTTLAGNVVEVTTIGISVGQTAQGGNLTAGYNHEVTAAFHDNVFVLGNPVTAIAAAGSQNEALR